MDKEFRKSIETELAILINSSLSKRNEKAAAAASKQIKEGVRNIAKKFVKNLPAESKSTAKTKLKKVKTKSKAAVKRKKVTTGKRKTTRGPAGNK